MSVEERFKSYYEFTHRQWLLATAVYRERALVSLLETDRLILAKYLKPFGFRPINPHIVRIASNRRGWKRKGWKAKSRRQRRERLARALRNICG